MLTVFAGAVVVAGCGGSDSSDISSDGSAKVAEAKKLVAQYQQVSEWEAPGPAFKPDVEGKRVMFIQVDASIPTVITTFESYRDSAELLGMSVTSFDGKGQVSEFNRGIQTAIAQDYDAVTFVGIPSSLVAAGIQEAVSQGITVIQGEERDPGIKLMDEVSGQVTFRYSTIGKMLAAWMVADSDGNAKGTIFVSPDVGNGVDGEGGIVEETKRLCPGCVLNTEYVKVADWNSDLPTLTQSILTSQPDTNYLLPLYDSQAVPIMSGLAQAGTSDQVSIGSFAGDTQIMESMASGSPVKADVGANIEAIGWGFTDQTARVLSGVEPVEDENVPLRLFTPDNVDELDLSDPNSWYGEPVFKDGYKKLWGLTG